MFAEELEDERIAIWSGRTSENAMDGASEQILGHLVLITTYIVILGLVLDQRLDHMFIVGWAVGLG